MNQIALNNGSDFIKRWSDLKKSMNVLGIENILTGKEILTTTESIIERSPTLLNYLLGEQTELYISSVKEEEANLRIAYDKDPSLSSIHNAILNNLQTNNIAIDRNLTQANIPQPAAGSIAINPLIRLRTNVKLNDAKNNQEKNAPLDPIFIETANTPILSYAETNSVAKRWAELEKRNLTPTPNATIEQLRQELPPSKVLKATSNFSASENSKETSTSRLQELDKNASYFFETVLTPQVTNSICSEQVKQKRWHDAYELIIKKFTSREKLTNAIEEFQEELDKMKYIDPNLYSSEHIDHFINRVAEAEANIQIAQQYLERSPPLLPVALAGAPPTAMPASQWHLTKEDFIKVVYEHTDDEIGMMHPHSKMYRRDNARMLNLINKMCEPAGSENDKVRIAWMSDVNRNPPQDAYTTKAFIARMRIAINLRANNETTNQTISVIKVRPIVVNKTTTTPAGGSKNPSTANSSNNNNQLKPLKHCDTCEEHRPTLQTADKQMFIFQTHNTKECKQNGGVMHKQQISGDQRPNNNKRSIINSDDDNEEEASEADGSEQTQESDEDSESSRKRREKRRKKQQLCMLDLANKFKVTDNNNNRYKCLYGSDCAFKHLANKQAVGTAPEALRLVKRSFSKDSVLRSKLAKAIRTATDLPK